MEELFGIVGNRHFLINVTFDEACIFDDFGGYLGECNSSSAKIECISNLKSTNIISIVGKTGVKKCELYLNGEVTIVNENYLNVVGTLTNKLKKMSYLVYRRNMEDNVTQVCIPIKKSSTSAEYLSKLLSCGEWTRLKV